MTEPFCNPNVNRARTSDVSHPYPLHLFSIHRLDIVRVLLLSLSGMSELLFEQYSVPSVAYGVDSLFSLYKNRGSAGTQATSCKLKRLFPRGPLHARLWSHATFPTLCAAETGSHLVFSSGHHGSYVAPVVKGRPDPDRLKRYVAAHSPHANREKNSTCNFHTLMFPTNFDLCQYQRGR